MEISEVRIKLVQNRSDRLKGFCSITLDNDFVIRDLKIIEGVGGYFVAMPSRKITDRCPACGSKNHLKAKFCNECGKRLAQNQPKARGERLKLHADIAHPINSTCREMIQKKIIESYHKEVKMSQQPGYKPTRMDDLEEDIFEEYCHKPEKIKTSSPSEKPAVNTDFQTQKTPDIPAQDNTGFSEGLL
ncbi:MAG: SpoVG family protein [Sedimentisphaerales bacterium]|nr:SpoVG family protein [Sedimentisphaerales bacterium]